jgi:hypothetical protein
VKNGPLVRQKTYKKEKKLFVHIMCFHYCQVVFVTVVCLRHYDEAVVNNICFSLLTVAINYCHVIFVQQLGIVTSESNADVLFIVIFATKNLLVTCYWGPKIVKITPLFLTGYPRNVTIISLLVTCSKYSNAP